MKQTLTILLILTFITLIGCQIQEPTIIERPIAPGTGTYQELSLSYDQDINTNKFTSEDELLAWVKDNQGGYNNYYGGIARTFSVGAAIDDVAMVESAVAEPAAAKGGDQELDYSETNIQVAGVDEADIIKTDGNYIYTISGKILFIIKAYPGEDAEIVSKIKLENTPESLFIKDDHLAVFGNFNDNNYFKKLDFRPIYGMSYLNIYNTQDKENPELIKEYKFEGNYFRGRMTDGYMYILTTTQPNIYYPRPIIFEGTTRTSIPVENIHYFDIPYNNPIFLNIHAIKLDEPEETNSESIVVEGSQNLYMSQDNIYVTYTEHINEYQIEQDITMEFLEPKLTLSDKELIEKIKKTDNEVLSNTEKRSKIFAVYQKVMNSLTQDEQDDLRDDIEVELKDRLEQLEHFEFTNIHKINVDELEITPIANGKVPGSIVNQFSLDENNNILRIATTINARWPRFSKRTESTNNIYTLDKDLNILDELEGLAKDERIYSTRFMGDRLYLVTFKQVDPFFVIDLSNPNNIKELGELKIPGFSRYLHPYEDETIIGIGQDATETGRTTGLKISLFDVSNVKKPKEIAKYTTESRYASSSALYEHKAFLFSKEKNLLVIPAYNYNYEDDSENYNGAFVFNIEKDNIELRGLIDHSQGKSDKFWQPYVERSLYIEELLYTKSSGLLRINKIEDLSSVKSIELDYNDPGIPIY